MNITLWMSSSVNRTLCLYCTPVSLTRYENTPPDWRGIILSVIERTWIVSVIINILFLVIINIVNTTVLSFFRQTNQLTVCYSDACFHGTRHLNSVPVFQRCLNTCLLTKHLNSKTIDDQKNSWDLNNLICYSDPHCI